MRLELPELTIVDLALVGGSDQPEKLATLEEELFGIKDYFLRQPVIIPLYQTRIRRVLWVEAAIRVIKGESSEQPYSETLDLSGIKSEVQLIGLIRTWADLQNQQRLNVASAPDGWRIAKAAFEMCRIEEEYMRRLVELTTDRPDWNDPVKAADRPDAGDLIWMLKKDANDPVLGELLSKERRRCQDLLARMDAA